jgi:hypothetical protein
MRATRCAQPRPAQALVEASPLIAKAGADNRA